MLLDQIFLKRGIRRGDSNTKSILKTISWRIVGTMDTMLITYLVTGELGIAISIGTVELFTKMVLYYFHERLWNKFV